MMAASITAATGISGPLPSTGGNGSPPAPSVQGHQPTHHQAIHSAQVNNNERSEIPSNNPSVLFRFCMLSDACSSINSS